MNRGYIKVWRKALDAGWLKNHNLWVFWTYCLMKATHKEFDAIVGCQSVHLNPGEFVFGLNKASEDTNLSVRSIRTLLAFLQTTQNLTIKTTNKFSIISITNWDTYQITEEENDKLNDKPLTNNRQTTDNIQEHKNINTKEKKIYIPLPFENIKLTQKEYVNLRSKFGEVLLQKALKFYSDYKIEKKYKSHNDNLTIQRWVIDAVTKKEGNNGTGNDTFKRTIRTERDAINQAACDEAELLAREYYRKHPPTNGDTKAES